MDKEKFRFAVIQINLYLSTHLDILSKKFVFFVQNEENLHWWGWAAINPWVKIAQVLMKRSSDKEVAKDSEYSNHIGYVSGLLPCDGTNAAVNFRDSLCFIWFLNLAAAYRDIHLDDQLDKLDIKNHSPKSYWLLGCCGPFGVIDIHNESRIEYHILSVNNYISPKQKDASNCGILWCLFIYDIMMQAIVPYDLDLQESNNFLPISLGIGKTWLFPELFQELNNLK